MTDARDPTLAWISTALCAMCGAVVVWAGVEEAGTRTMVRATARTSALILCLALSSWMFDPLARRRAALIRSLAVSHGLHLVAIVWLAVLTRGANLMERAHPVTAIGGFLAYAVIAAGAIRPRQPFVEWGLLWVAVSFLSAYGGRALREPWIYGPVVALLLVAVALRVAGPFVHRVRSPKEDLAT
jgi:methionine sulfoxide reductase heme-binding subunit